MKAGTLNNDEMVENAKLIAKHFIARPDNAAQQSPDGAWRPTGHPFTMDAILAHLRGDVTLGHYTINPRNETKIIVFDIDLDKTGTLPIVEDQSMPTYFTNVTNDVPLVEAWHDRTHPARAYMKTQMKMAASVLAKASYDALGIQTAVEYSGNKGLHVYGFMGSGFSAADAYEATQLVMQSTGRFTPRRGNNFWKDLNQEDLIMGFGNLTVETFPKQPEVASEGFGNLVALPLGRNLKHPVDEKFFVSLVSPMSEMKPVSLATAINYGQWADEQMAV